MQSSIGPPKHSHADANPPRLEILPPLLNSANPWATTAEDLTKLYECTSTGAVTVRTCMVGGFNHDPARHQYAFFDAAASVNSAAVLNSSVNSLGYSPVALESYLAMIEEIAGLPLARPSKGFIISVTGTPEGVAQCYADIARANTDLPFQLAMEINLSCPNIPNAPPPAYSAEALVAFLKPLVKLSQGPAIGRIPFGIKTPPYTHSTEFQGLINALLAIARENEATNQNTLCPVSFITATNTLGSCLLLQPDAPHSRGHPGGTVANSSTQYRPALPSYGLGGMAGAALHPLALGNVATLRRMLDVETDVLGHIQLIGVGGVSDAEGYRRMRAVGADFVGVGTALGIKGVDVFKAIEDDLGGRWDTRREVMT